MTILFKNDWLNHPGAVIHYATKNESFLKVAEIYHRMGIENCAFHLSLLDPDLYNVDPFDENLSLVMKAKIIRECKRNFWYYLREMERVPEQGSMQAVPFNANRMNIALYWLFFNHVMTIVVILRQTGKTTTLSVLIKYILNFGAVNTLINFLTKSEGLKAETLIKIKTLFEELPEYANLSSKKDIFNTDEIFIKDFQNKVKGSLSSSSPKQAEKVGRGYAAPVAVIDEGAYIENVAIAMGAMLMAGNAARVNAAKNNNPYGTLIATTAGDIDTRDGGYMYSIVTGATVWDDRYLDCPDLDSLMKIIYANCASDKNENKRPIVNITMSYRQLGLSEEWMQKTLRDNISTPENIKRDLYNQWLSGSSASPIPKEYIEILRDNSIEQAPWSAFYNPHNYLLRWYVSPQEIAQRTSEGHHFSIGVDTSDGSGGDDISFWVRDHVFGDVICTATFNEINLITLADFFVSFLIRYKNSTMIIERKSSAGAMIDHITLKLMAVGINPFTRLYNTIFQNKETMEKEYNEVSRIRSSDQHIVDKYKRHIGFITSGSGVTARSDLYSSTMIHMLKFTAHLTKDEVTVNQLCALVIRNGRVDHPPGGNDDMVIGALLSYWLLIKGRNLQHYGIDTSKLLRRNNIYLEDKYKSDEESYDQQEILRMEEEFNSLLEELKAERDSVIAKQLECRLRKLASECSNSGNVISVEEMLEEISRERRMRRYNESYYNR